MRHFDGQLLTVDLVDASGTRVSSESWSFQHWFAVASSGSPFLARTPSVRPYIRNVHVPAELQRRCLCCAPFPSDLGMEVTCSLFMGAPLSRTRLHCDGIHNAVMVLHGLKLIVVLAPEPALSSAELVAVNTVLCGLADQPMRGFPRGDAAGRSTGRMRLGNLELCYFWLEPGAVVTIPCGWYHFVHNHSYCISVILWARLPRSCGTPQTQGWPTSIEHLGLPAGHQHGLLALPGRLLEYIICFCIDSCSSSSGAVVSHGVSAVCGKMRRVECADAVWEFAFRFHWGVGAALSAVPLGPCWKDRYLQIRRMVVEEFRVSPKAALKKCGRLSLMDVQSPDDVAHFLHRHVRLLDKLQLGEHLADSRQHAVLEAWMRELSIHFRGISLEACLRLYLLYVKLPGEAPKIDRMLELLARLYCAENPEADTNEDTSFVLLFTMLSLNSDLHNPNVKNKMTLEAFIRSNKGINNGGDLPPEYLRELYDSIKQSSLWQVESRH